MSVVSERTGYRVSFRYGEKEVSPYEHSSKVFRRPTTTCVIEDDERAVVGMGVVTQYFRDEPNTAVGRKEAFKKAVAVAFPGVGRENDPTNRASRPGRIALWDDMIEVLY